MPASTPASDDATGPHPDRPGSTGREGSTAASDDVPDDALNLLHLIYSMIMVSMAVEIFGTQKPADSADAKMYRVSTPVP